MGICNRDCNKCNLKLHCQGCSYCEMIYCKEDCNECLSLCPKRGGSFAYLKKLGGGEVFLEKNPPIDLPHHIPILKDRLTEPLNLGNVIGIHASSMFSNNGESITRGYLERGLTRALNTQNEIEGVLQFYVKDRTLEGFWDERKYIYTDLKLFNWRAIISPNFSVYEDAPRIDHLYNMKRTSIVYNELIQKGFPAIPDISWYNQIDLDQWIREIKKNNIKTVAFSFQVVDVRLKASNIWKHYLMGYKYMCLRIPEDVATVIIGIISPRRLEAVRKAAGPNRKLIILNQTAYLQSRRGILSEGEKKIPKEEMSKNEILKLNVKYYNQKYKKLNQGQKE